MWVFFFFSYKQAGPYSGLIYSCKGSLLSANICPRFTSTRKKTEKLSFVIFLWLKPLFLDTKKESWYYFSCLRIAWKHNRSFLMSQTSVTIARRAKSELESGEGSWFADENGDKSPCGWEGAQQPVNFHFLVLYLFFPFLVTQKITSEI